MSEEYDIKESLKSVRQLYPVLLDANGEVIDGFHRLEIDGTWRTEKLDHIKTPTQLYLARIVANTHRREISASEREEQIGMLAKSLEEFDKLPREEIIKTVSELTGFSYRYVQKLIPEEYKRAYSKSELSSQFKNHEKLAKEEQPPLEEYLKDYFEKTYSPDIEFLLWILFKNYGLSEKEARKAIAKANPRKAPKTEKKEGEQPAKEAPPSKYEVPQSPTCRCPMCMRDGADKLGILTNFVENTVTAQMTLFDFVTEALK